MVDNNRAYLLVLAFVLMGIICLGISIGINNRIKKKKKRCKYVTSAMVVEMKRERTDICSSQLGTYAWFPTYQYAVNGQVFRKKSHMGVSKEIFTKGQKVQLYYNPRNCNEYYVPGEKKKEAVIILATIGCGLLAVGIIGIGMIVQANGVDFITVWQNSFFGKWLNT